MVVITIHRAEYRKSVVQTFHKRNELTDSSCIERYREELKQTLFNKLKDKIRYIYKEEPEIEYFGIAFSNIEEKIKLHIKQKFPDGSRSMFAEKIWKSLLDSKYPSNLFEEYKKEYKLQNAYEFRPKKHHIVTKENRAIIDVGSLLHPVYGSKNKFRQVTFPFPCIDKRRIKFSMNEIFINGKQLSDREKIMFTCNEGWDDFDLMMKTYDNKEGWLIIWDEI